MGVKSMAVYSLHPEIYLGHFSWTDLLKFLSTSIKILLYTILKCVIVIKYDASIKFTTLDMGTEKNKK